MLGIYCRTSKETKNLSIEQQKQLGIEFAVSHAFDYKIYPDEGISGYKIDDDDLNPFANRPEFTSLINDIKARKIHKVGCTSIQDFQETSTHRLSFLIFSGSTKLNCMKIKRR